MKLVAVMTIWLPFIYYTPSFRNKDFSLVFYVLVYTSLLLTFYFCSSCFPFITPPFFTINNLVLSFFFLYYPL